jgi:hypothetical protein
MLVDRPEAPGLTIDRGTEQDLYRVAYGEYRITRQFSTGNGNAYVAVWKVPRWFWSEELGYGAGEGPTLEETLRTLRRTNGMRRKLYKALMRGKHKRAKKAQLSTELRAVIEGAGYSVADLLDLQPRRMTLEESDQVSCEAQSEGGGYLAAQLVS